MFQTNQAHEERIDSLLAEMSLDEKIGQLHQAHPYPPVQPEELRNGRVGSLLNAAGALTGQSHSVSSKVAELNSLQRLALEAPRHIPLLFGRDVIHGYRTVFPIPLGQAAAFNPVMTEQAATVAAREASADGIKWTFAPMVDIARDPRWGRVAEGAGEDTYLGRLQAAAMVSGFQGTNFSAPDRLAACAKHFAGYGGAEGGRDYDASEISMRTMRQVYLPPFQAAVDAGVATLMSAFHDLNGLPMTAQGPLLTGVLREEWGFQGFVVSDWASVDELVKHGVAANRAQAATMALRAGVEMDMVSKTYLENLGDLLLAGKISLQELELAVRRVLRVKLAAGLFDRPFTDESRVGREILTPEHRSLARQFATQSMVLLKNDGSLLPLHSHFRRVAVVGPLVHARGELLGSWAPDGRAQDMVSISEALQAAAPADMQFSFAESADEALWRAIKADLVVAVVGEHPLRSGENNNVASLELPPGQRQFVEQLAALGKPLVLVVVAGRPLALAREAALAQALLYVFQPGTEGAAALADVLLGVVEPGGHLPITLPRVTGQVPLYYNHKSSGRPVSRESMFDRRYVDVAHGPLFPFGHGLGYTTIAYRNLALSSTQMKDTIQISADISNAGPRPGLEVVQLYVRDLVGQVTRPVKELKGFERLVLQPGETQRVNFVLQREDLAYVGLDERWLVEPGTFQVWIGPSSAGGLQGTFELV